MKTYLINILITIWLPLSCFGYVKTEDIPAPLGTFLETKNLLKTYQNQTNQNLPEKSVVFFQVENLNTWQPQLTSKSQASFKIYLVKAKLKLKYKVTNTVSSEEEETELTQIFQGVYLYFENQKKMEVLDQFFSFEDCDGDHVLDYTFKALPVKLPKEQSFFLMDRKMQAEFCDGDLNKRNWQDSYVYFVKPGFVKKVFSYDSYDKKEKLSYFLESNETYVYSQSYSRTDLFADKTSKDAPKLILKSINHEGIEKPNIYKLKKYLKWKPKEEQFEVIEDKE